MSRRAIVQIGTEKTGSTTLQHFLSVNRQALATRGFVYPRFCGAINHTGLAAYAMAPGRKDTIKIAFGGAEAADVPAMRERMRRAAALELGGPETAIFCSEHCHSRLVNPAEVATLHALLGEFFDDIQISVYLRRQDRVAVSLYSTRLKSGWSDAEILPETAPDNPYYNYDRFLSLWEAEFGGENLRVRLFDRNLLVGGSVVDDFLATWGLGTPGDYRAVNDLNESIQPAAQEFLRLVNGRLRPVPGVPADDVRGPLVARLAKLLPGRGARPARAAAEAFYARYAASNEAVRARYFPDRSALFDTDFSAYPEVADAREVGIEDFATIAAELHVLATREARRLEAEVAVREARLLWQRDKRAEAERALRRGLAWMPDHPESQRTLGEFLLQLERLDEAVAAARRAAELRPDRHEYWHFLGMLLRRTGDPAGALAAYRRALELEPDHAPSQREIDRLGAAGDAGPSNPDETGSWPRPLSA